MLQNTFKSRKITVRIWDNVGVIIPKFDQNFEINSKKLQQSSVSQIFFVYAFKNRLVNLKTYCRMLPTT